MIATEVKERPILFSSSMVRSILEGRKTVTRRVVKESWNGCLTNGGPHPCPNDPVVVYPGEIVEDVINGGDPITVAYPEVRAIFHCSTLDAEAKCPYGKPGDIVWVRETWSRVTVVNSTTFESTSEYRYKADHKGAIIKGHDRYKPSIHMPKSACRLKLEILSIGVERLQDITLSDVLREGIQVRQFSLYGLDEEGRNNVGRIHFKKLWQSINGAESWNINPWVWRIEFKKL